MKKQCVVIGLGKFGLMVAKKLSEAGMDILAIDKDMKRVEKANAFASKVYEEAAKANQNAESTDTDTKADNNDDNVVDATYEEK